MDIDSAIEHMSREWSPETQEAVDTILLELNARGKLLEQAEEYAEAMGPGITEARAWGLAERLGAQSPLSPHQQEEITKETLRVAFRFARLFAEVAAEVAEANAQSAEFRRTEGKG